MFTSQEVMIGMLFMLAVGNIVGFRVGISEGVMRLREKLRANGMRSYIPGEAIKP